MEYILFFVGLGFFLYIIFIIERADQKRWDRKMTEWREFGRPKLNNIFRHRDR